MISILCGCKVFARIAITVTGGIRHLDKEYISAAFKDIQILKWKCMIVRKRRFLH